MIDFNDINYDDKQIRFDTPENKNKKNQIKKKLFDMYL